jgi:hypothetical protein
MSQIFVEGGDLTKTKGDVMGKLAEFLNNIHSLKIQAKVDGKGVTISPKAAATKTPVKKGAKKKGKKTAQPEATSANLAKSKLKVYLKRFINNQGLSDSMRVISTGPETYTFHEKPILGENLAPLEEEE